MSSTEEDHAEWAELRQRVDSLSGSVFLLGGGAITVSASALMTLKASGYGMDGSVMCSAVWSWISLLVAILMFILLKAHLVLQSYARVKRWTGFYGNVDITNPIGFLVGIGGLLAFFIGMLLIVISAAELLGA